MGKSKVEGKGVETFEIELVDLTLRQRQQLHSLLNKLRSDEFRKENGELYYCFDIALLGTGMSEEELNKYSDEQILAIAVKVMEQGSKKK
tara:strand:+ start:298 stop:567 length:270 start_codon:yes stop_codon:yes gene_type:complete